MSAHGSGPFHLMTAPCVAVDVLLRHLAERHARDRLDIGATREHSAGYPGVDNGPADAGHLSELQVRQAIILEPTTKSRRRGGARTGHSAEIQAPRISSEGEDIAGHAEARSVGVGA